jgi:DNA replication protein DnaC
VRPGRLDCPRYLLRLCELELLGREQRATERRIKAAKFPVVKSLETFAFRAIPSLNKRLVLELTRPEYLDRRENVLALGNSGTGKTHLALALGLAACQKGYRVRFITAAALVNELLEARDEKRLLRVQKQLATSKICWSWTRSATCRCPRPVPSCCSRSSPSATSRRQRS